MKAPKVTIIILNWNGIQDTSECLESLRQISYKNYDVIVVDNGSEGEDVRILSERFGGWIDIVENEKNYGFSKGNNIGIQRALETSDPDYLLLLNNDTVVDRGFLDELVTVSEGNPRIGIVGPKIYYYDEPDRLHFAGGAYIRQIAQPFHIGQDEIDKGQYEEVSETGYITACTLLIKKELIQEIGLLDEDYFIYYEELDWSVKARQKGYSIVYVPTAKVWHKVSSVSGLETPFYTYFSTRNRILFVRKNASILDFLLLFIPSFALLRFLGPLLLFTVRGKWRAIEALLMGVRDGLANRLQNVERWR